MSGLLKSERRKSLVPSQKRPESNKIVRSGLFYPNRKVWHIIKAPCALHITTRQRVYHHGEAVNLTESSVLYRLLIAKNRVYRLIGGLILILQARRHGL